MPLLCKPFAAGLLCMLALSRPTGAATPAAGHCAALAGELDRMAAMLGQGEKPAADPETARLVALQQVAVFAFLDRCVRPRPCQEEHWILLDGLAEAGSFAAAWAELAALCRD